MVLSRVQRGDRGDKERYDSMLEVCVKAIWRSRVDSSRLKLMEIKVETTKTRQEEETAEYLSLCSSIAYLTTRHKKFSPMMLA